MQNEQSLVRKNLEKLSKKLFLFVIIVCLMFVLVDFIKIGYGALLSQQIFTLLALIFVFILDKVKPSYNMRIGILLLIGLTHLPMRHYHFHTVMAPPLLWYLMIPTFAIFFMNEKIGKVISGICFLEVFVVSIIIKMEEGNGFGLENFTSMELNTLIGWSCLNFILTLFFLRLNGLKKHYSDLIDSRFASDFQISKMSSLGEMAGTMAHEINNPLAVINGNIILLENKIKKLSPPEIENYLFHTEKCKNIINLVGGITDSMLRLSRTDHARPTKQVNFNQAFDMALSIVKIKILDSHVKLMYDEKNLDQMALLNQEVVAQTLINLLSNSIGAVKDQTEPWIKVFTKIQDNRLLVFVVDSGNGISPEIVEKMFEPFFTTKPIGEGTGFGLAITKSILSDMDSEISYELYEGHTAFKLSFPLS